MVKNISEEIQNKIIELKNDGETINYIINHIFENHNTKITKYSINKILADAKNKTTSETSSELSETKSNNKTNTSTSSKSQIIKSNVDINIKNNSLINDLNNNSEIDDDIPNNKNNNNQQTKFIFEEVPPINKPNKNLNNNTNDIINDVINNTQGSDLDNIKEKRSYIIIIRQYINLFENELKTLYGNKEKFNQKLFKLKLDELKLLLENIRIHLNISKNSNLFMDCAKNALIGYEKVLCYSGIDINGFSDEILKNEEFIYDLKCISAEIDMTKYINNKTWAFLKVFQNSYLSYEKNKIIKNIDQKFNNDDVLNKIKNISK